MRERISAPSIKTPEEGQGMVDEILMYGLMFRCPDFMSKMKKWRSMRPQVVVESCIQTLPDRPVYITAQQSIDLDRETGRWNGELSVFDHGIPTDLEAYFTYMIAQRDPKRLQFDSVEIKQFTGDEFVPMASIICLRDTVRVKRFTKAIKSAVASFPEDRPLVVCDAGSGAYPIMAITALLERPNITAVCIESNARSVELSRDLFDALGLSGRVRVLHGDARSIQVPHKIDILVSETMDAGLIAEPQIQVLEHLRKDLRHDGVMIPQTIDVYATLIGRHELADVDSYLLFDTMSDPVLPTPWIPIDKYERPGSLQRIETTLPLIDEPSFVFMSCELTLFGNVRLPRDMSRITAATRLGGVVLPPRSFMKRHVDISYTPGDTPDQSALTIHR